MVGVCRWDSEALTLKQTKFSCILQPYTGWTTEIPTLSQTGYFSETRSLSLRESRNAKSKIFDLLRVQQQLKHVFEYQFQGNLV